MSLSELRAVSPIDGRYHSKTKELQEYFSEYALFKYRVWVEIEYFIQLCELPLPQLKGFDPELYGPIRNIYLNFSEADAAALPWGCMLRGFLRRRWDAGRTTS